MKIRHPFTCLFALVLGGLGVAQSTKPESGNDLSQRIGRALDSLPALLKEDPTGLQAQKYLNRQRLSGSIQSFFYGAPGAAHEYTPERQARVNQVEDWLEPYQAALIGLVKEAASHSSVPNAAEQLLMFSRPTSALKQAMVEIAVSPRTTLQNAEHAYGVLFSTQLDDEQLRSDVLKLIDVRDQLTHRAQLGKMLLVKGANAWAMSELEPLYHSLLSSSFHPKDSGHATTLLGQYTIAARGLSAHGTAALPASAALKQRLAEVRNSKHGNANAATNLSEAIEIVEGRKPPRLAMSPKGQLLGASAEAYRLWLGRAGSSNTSMIGGRVLEPGSNNQAVAYPVGPRASSEMPIASERSGALSIWAWVIVAGLTVLLATAFWMKR